MRPTRPQIPYVVTFKCGHTSGRKTRIDTPGYIARKQRAASLTLCPACAREQVLCAEAKRYEKRLASIEKQIPEDATELERAVAIAIGFDRHPGFIVTAEPFLDPFFDLEDDAVIVYVTRKNAEATLSRLRSENPGAVVSLIGFSDPDELRSYELLYLPSR